MPELLRAAGFRFFFYSDEGFEPPHVHVEHGDGTAKFWLDPIQLAFSSEMKAQLLRRASDIVVEHQQQFLRKWHEFFAN